MAQKVWSVIKLLTEKGFDFSDETPKRCALKRANKAHINQNPKSSLSWFWDKTSCIVTSITVSCICLARVPVASFTLTHRAHALPFINGSQAQRVRIRLLALKRYDLFFKAKSREDPQQKHTIYISKPKAKTQTFTFNWHAWYDRNIPFPFCQGIFLRHDARVPEMLNSKGTTIFRGVHEKIRFVFRDKAWEDLQQKGTIYTSEPKSPNGAIIRHGIIIRVLMVNRTHHPSHIRVVTFIM